MDGFVSAFKQTLMFYRSLSPARKAALVFMAVTTLAIILTMGIWAREGEYIVLWSNVEKEEVQGILNTLSSKGIPYQLQDNGTTILVPRAKAAKLRIELTSSGVTQGGKIMGFEIFDKNSLGSTSYIQKINFRRALEGELTKSIKQISGVERVRVHLVIPDQKTFLVDQKKPTASVVVKLSSGRILDENVVRGMSNLVASAVEGLQAEEVAILDHKGRLLSSSDKDELTRISNDRLRYKTRLERALENRASTILGRIVGRNNVEVRVSADVDFTKQTLIQEQYDPDGAVLLSQVTMNEKFQGQKANPSGIPGSRTNLPNQQNTVEPPGTQHSSDRNTETVNYNVSKKVINTEKPTAKISKLSVSVVVNSQPVKNKDGKIEKYEKRKDLKELEVLAKNAIGFEQARGDSFTIESLPFRIESFEEADNFLKEFTKNKLIRDLIWFGLVGAMILMFFFFVIRPFLNWVIDKTSEEETLPASVEEIETGNTAIAALKDTPMVQIDDKFNPEKAESEALIDKIRMIVSKHPAKAVGALKPWINNSQQ